MRRGENRLTAHVSAAASEEAQQLLNDKYSKTCGLDAGLHCRKFGCEPRVWHVVFDSDLPKWDDADVVASLDGWSASGAVVKDSHLHHGRFGIRWKSSGASITGNRTRHGTILKNE